MQNQVPSAEGSQRPSAADQAVDRALRGKRQVAVEEVQRLIDAALALIQQTGDLEPRVSEIVKQAGLHNQAFYRHFRSKRELLVAVLDQGIGGLAGYLEHRMETASTPEARVREWVRGVLEQAVHRDGAQATRPFVLARGRLAEAFPDEVRASEEQLTVALRAAIADGVAAGDFPAANPDRDAEILYLLAMGWVQNRLLDPSSPGRDDATALEEFALAGLTRERADGT
jgi:AcrR family transcriptional regulator